MTSNNPSDSQAVVTKSDLITYISSLQPHLSERDVELSVNSILHCMSAALVDGERVEIRGFGSLTLRHRAARLGRNPKTGESVQVAEKYVPYFRAGTELRKRVNHTVD